MYCPQCRDEYRPGFTTCAYCQIPLVHELPLEPDAEAKPSPLPDLVILYEAAHPEVDLLRSVLEGSGIEAAVRSGGNAAYPVTVGDLGRSQIFVRRSDAERAREVIAAALSGEFEAEETP